MESRPNPTTSPDTRQTPEVPGEPISRRRFISLVSASAALAAGASSCSRIDRGTVVPYTKQPEEVVPGKTTLYASTFPDGLSPAPVLVRTREGRPIHVEGSDLEAKSAGARAIGDLLGLYDPDRLRRPLRGKEPAGWDESIAAIVEELKKAAASGKGVLLVTEPSLSPTRRALLEAWTGAIPGARVVSWQPAPDGVASALAPGAPGVRARPRLDRADVILALQADFLGPEGDPRQARDFARRRRGADGATPGCRLYALEGSMTLTGANADHRVRLRPTRVAALALALARRLHEEHARELPDGVAPGALAPFDLSAIAREIETDGASNAAAVLEALVRDLHGAGGNAVVLAGPTLPIEARTAARLLNRILGAEGTTVEAEGTPTAASVLDPAGLDGLLQEAAKGAFAVGIFWGVNPAYAHRDPSAWKAAAAAIPFKVRIGLHADETAEGSDVVLPEHHWLEAWGDHEARAGVLTLQQPAISPLHDTRQGEDALLAVLRGLGRDAPKDYLTFLRGRWERELYEPTAGALETIEVAVPPQTVPASPPPSGGEAPPEGGGEKTEPRKPISFEMFWNAALHDGVHRRPVESSRFPDLPAGLLEESFRGAAIAPPPGGRSIFELVLGASAALGDGRHANNGWLQELPDPVTKVTWANPVAVSVEDAARLEIFEGDVVRLVAGDVSVEAPAIVQPGQAPGVLSIALGYGRRSGSVAIGIGSNAYPLVDPDPRSPFLRTGVDVTKTGARATLSITQGHHTMAGRDLARVATRYEVARGALHDRHAHKLWSLYPEIPAGEHKWGMAIDLSACTGCSACVVACQSENNVPVVGPERVAEGREMHWIRIDRYYTGDERNPGVVHQPVACQHCDNAPCEAVCPVNATTHSPDGLNQMTYNRCVGTRYCANNCPYKVRRFNYFEFTAFQKEPALLANNPEVTVRPRGVMEKCTFCIQRIQEGRMQAAAEGRPVRDGEIRPACQVACPTDAIVFGDLSQPDTAVSRASRDERGYKLLEEFGIRPVVTYLARVTNPAIDTPGSEGAGHGGAHPQ